MLRSRILIDIACESKKDVQGTHHTPAWLGRVTKDDVPAVVRFLRSQGYNPRVVYRDKSTDRPKRYARAKDSYGPAWSSGWSRKENATHADIYDTGDRHDYEGMTAYYDLHTKTAQLTAIRSALRGKITADENVLTTISKNPQWAYLYAKNAVKGPWLKGEPVLRNSKYWEPYVNMVHKSDPDTGAVFTGHYL